MIGFTWFALGGALRMYMVVRVNGWQGYLKPQKGVIESYRRLVADKQAPSWPLPASYLCIALGILIAFGSVLVS